MRLVAKILLLCVALAASNVEAQKKINFGGTNHWLYSYGTADGNNTGGTWYVPALNLRPTVAHYHLNPGLVNSQINALRASGQNAYVIFIWNKDVGICEFGACNDGVADGVWGEVIDHSWGIMRPQHRANLKAIVGQALDAGFSRIYIRFGYNGDSPSWSFWDEGRYQKAWNFIVDARTAAIEAVASRGLTSKLAHPRNLLMFDLGAEDGGLTGGQRQAFMARLWSDYTFTFGVDDTLGFSFAWAPGRFTIQRNLLQTTGILPKHWGFDIYEGMGSALSSIYSEMGSLRNQPIHLLETYFNNASMSSQVSSALASNELLNIHLIAQWPLNAGFNHGHFSQQAVDSMVTTGTFTNYLPQLAARKMHISATNANVLGLRDVDCAATLSWPCSVRLHWGSPPSGRRYGIYINTPSGTSLVHCVTSAGQTNVSWISLNPSYVFDIYEINSSSCGHPSPNVGAILRASAEATPFGY